MKLSSICTSHYLILLNNCFVRLTAGKQILLCQQNHRLGPEDDVMKFGQFL
jgi:hypothetical protein